MTEDNKNIITIDLDLNTLISSSKRTDALQNTISEKLKSNSFVNNIAADLVRDHIKDSVLQGFSDEVEKMIKATYGTKEAIQKMVDSNSHNVRMQILEIMKNKTEIVFHQGKTYSTEELQEKYIVLGFGLGFVTVKNKATGEKGSLDFDHMPRIYYDYVKYDDGSWKIKYTTRN